MVILSTAPIHEMPNSLGNWSSMSRAESDWCIKETKKALTSTGETSPLNAKCKHIVANKKGVKAHWIGRLLHDYKLVIQTWVNRNLFQVERYPVQLTRVFPGRNRFLNISDNRHKVDASSSLLLASNDNDSPKKRNIQMCIFIFECSDASLPVS